MSEYGLISNYEDYLALPAGVLADARLQWEYESKREEVRRRRGSYS